MLSVKEWSLELMILFTFVQLQHVRERGTALLSPFLGEIDVV